jgi:hypothetical protein
MEENWASLFTGESSAAKSVRIVYEFRGNKITRRTEIFKAANCQGSAGLTMSETGTFDVHPKDQTSADGGRFIDMDFTKINVEVQSAEGAEMANQAGLCGADNWAEGNNRNVTASANDVSCFGMELPRRLQNIYKLEDNALFFGRLTDPSGADTTRPEALDRQTRFTKGDAEPID